MQTRSFFNPRSIKQRLMLLYGITIVLILALVATYTLQVVSLENKLETMEQVEDIFNSILALRRFEKNIMLRLGEKNVTNANQALMQLESLLTTLDPEIKTKQAQILFDRLTVFFHNYKTVFNSWCAINGCISHATDLNDFSDIRQQGQKLMESAAELARFNRENISHGFKIVLFWLTFMPAAVLVTGVILFFSQMQSILNRLASLKQGTKSLAAGEFKQLPMLNPPDEITRLVKNFNEMVVALEQKQEELIQSKKMASIGTFSSGIAHEINNPLNNISLSADTLIEEFNSMDEEETREILGDIMVQTERASKIVRNLLDFSRAQSSETQTLYIDFVLHKTTDLIANELRIHKIALKKDIADMLPQVNGDLQKLQQIFLNLIINAEQAIGDYGTIIVKTRATENGYIRTDIIDNGPGIAQENLEQIFDPFFTTKEAGKGTGLGLAIVYGIVKKHNGYIEVASELGKGTTFSVYLPGCGQIKEIKQDAGC